MAIRVPLARDRHGSTADRRSPPRTSGSDPATPPSNRSRPISGSSILRPQHVSRDHHAMHFGGTVVDPKRARFAIKMLERRVGGDTECSADLDGAIHDTLHPFPPQHPPAPHPPHL